jgi:two-component system NtrC family response regulator
MAAILVIDDEPKVIRLIQACLRSSTHSLDGAGTLAEGLAAASARRYDLVLLDVHLPDGRGLDVIGDLREGPSPPEVIIITGQGDPDGAQLAIRSGAWDYIAKPFSPAELTLAVKRVLQYRESVEASAAAPPPVRCAEIVGCSPRMQVCRHLLAQAAASDVNVLVTGATGTGKELFARAIHANSRRCDGPVVVVDCAALPETLVESLLFGHEKGAFTGADGAREGLIAQAHGGTLFLDEIGELPPEIQRVFLRTLQERTVRRVGARTESRCDFRLVAATNRNLEAMVGEGRFRADLLYRVRSLTIDLPELAERREDIKPLLFHFIDQACRRLGLPVKGFTPDFLEALLDYPWPGNVRELGGCLETAVAAAGEQPTLFPRHLPEPLRVFLVQHRLPSADGEAGAPHLPPYRDYRRQAAQRLDAEYVQRLMRQAGRDMDRAQAISGLSRSRLYELLKAGAPGADEA